MLLFHRFLIQERVGKHRRSRDVILTTCLFLAGKVTEAPRRLRDVINVLHMLTCTGQDEPPLLDKVRTCPCVLPPCVLRRYIRTSVFSLGLVSFSPVFVRSTLVAAIPL